VSKLDFETKLHPKPCKLQWIDESDEMVVNRQVVEVCFKIGKYEDVMGPFVLDFFENRFYSVT
jgi:hypothetical protein